MVGKNDGRRTNTTRRPFLRADVDVALDAGPITGHAGPIQFCAEFHRAHEPRSSSVRIHDERNPERVLSQFPVLMESGERDQVLLGMDHWCMKAVFVSDREVAEHGERLKPPVDIAVDSWVRLIPFDDCLIRWCKIGNIAAAVQPPVLPQISASEASEIVRVGFDRELDTLPLLLRERTAMPERELEGEVVEARTQIVDRVAEDERAAGEEFIERRHLADVYDMLARLRLILYADGWSIAYDRERVRDMPFQIIAVFASPLYLCPTPTEVRDVHGVDSRHEGARAR